MHVGAMENWGLVTYREVTLLVDPAQSSSAAKQTVALVVGHELAHQWFGNFVTMVSHLLPFNESLGCPYVVTESIMFLLCVFLVYFLLVQSGQWTKTKIWEGRPFSRRN